MAGRKKIPEHKKKLRGTDQPCRMDKNVVATTAITTLPKSGLKGSAKKVFELVATELFNNKLLEVVGLDLVVAYSREMALYHELMKEMEKDDEYTIKTTTKKGTTVIINPKRKIAESALANAKSLAIEFGLTPASRSRVSALLAIDSPKDEFTEFEEIR